VPVVKISVAGSVPSVDSIVDADGALTRWLDERGASVVHDHPPAADDVVEAHGVALLIDDPRLWNQAAHGAVDGVRQQTFAIMRLLLAIWIGVSFIFQGIAEIVVASGFLMLPGRGCTFSSASSA
jgi:hypothetical protein